MPPEIDDLERAREGLLYLLNDPDKRWVPQVPPGHLIAGVEVLERWIAEAKRRRVKQAGLAVVLKTNGSERGGVRDLRAPPRADELVRDQARLETDVI